MYEKFLDRQAVVLQLQKDLLSIKKNGSAKIKHQSSGILLPCNTVGHGFVIT